MSFDMEKAREIAQKCQSWDDDIDHVYWNAHAAERLSAALDEIERLQSDVDGLTTALADSGKNIGINSSQQAARIRELEAENKSDKTFQNLLIDNCNDLRRRAQEAEDRTIEANHRVLDLQYALDASEARRQEIAEKITSFATSFTCPECGAYIDLPDINALQKDVLEYDIGDHPGKMMLTKGQQEVLEVVCDLAEGFECKYSECAKDQEKSIKIVRSLLSLAAPAWEVTKERKAAITEALEWMPPYCDEVAVLRAMLEEARP